MKNSREPGERPVAPHVGGLVPQCVLPPVAGKALEEQGVTHNVKAMVLELKQSEEDVRKDFQVQEEEQNEAEQKEKRIQRTKRGLEILAERGTQGFGLLTSRGALSQLPAPPRGGVAVLIGFSLDSLTGGMSPSVLACLLFCRCFLTPIA